MFHLTSLTSRKIKPIAMSVHLAFCVVPLTTLWPTAEALAQQAEVDAPSAQVSQPGNTAVLKDVTVTAAGETDSNGAAAAGFSSRNAKIGVLGERPLLDTPFSVNVISAE
ncbi:MAG TPA: hypothetical protein VFV28_07965, partial [Limnobacter sp.]|nr:hypothetical protein [Limnobacter sp.]